MHRLLWIISVYLSTVGILCGNTLIEVQDPFLGTQQGTPLNVVAAGNNTFFIANNASIGSGGLSSIVGWFYNPGTSTFTEVQDPGLGTQLARPFNVVAAGNNTFFIANRAFIGTGGTSSIVGWFYNPGTSTLTQVQDPGLGTQRASPNFIAAAGNNTFFIGSTDDIGSGGFGSIVGWFYNPGTSTLTQLQDPGIGTQKGRPFIVVAAGNDTFFITNTVFIGNLGNGSIVGWFYNPGTATLTEVQDPGLGTQRAFPSSVAAAVNDNFFIENNDNISNGGLSNIVGWYYNQGTSTLTQVQDPSLGTQTGNPGPVVAAGNNTFFIPNTFSIGSGGFGDIVGWFYNPGTSTLTQVQDPSLGTQQANPFLAVAAGNNTFFTTNGNFIGSGGFGDIVGWYYNPGTSTLTQVQDPSLGTQQGLPENVAAAGNNTFFIANNDTIGNGGLGSIVGWFYDPGASTFTQVQDPSLGTQQGTPLNVVAAGNNTFFIANNASVGNGGLSSIVGWFYDPGASTFTQIQDLSLGTQQATPLNVVAAGNNTFFIANNASIGSGGLSSIVGWYFNTLPPPSALPPSSIFGFSERNRFLTQTDYFNLIGWTAPPGPTPSGYLIFRDAGLTDLIATLPNNVFEFFDHNRTRQTIYSYFVVSVLDGALSSPIEIQVYVN